MNKFQIISDKNKKSSNIKSLLLKKITGFSDEGLMSGFLKENILGNLSNVSFLKFDFECSKFSEYLPHKV